MPPDVGAAALAWLWSGYLRLWRRPMHPRVRFAVLGPLDADLVDGSGVSHPLALGPLKQRVLLAALLCRANTFVSVDRLTETLWDDPPRTAHKNLQVYVSHLRRMLSVDGRRDHIVHRTRGYSVRVAPEDLDATRFEELVSEGRQARRDGRTGQAAATLRAALDLWRGDALADLAPMSALRDEVSQLAARRLTVFEDWIEAELELGRHIEVLDGVERMVRANPLRERLRSQQMVALYRAGRQSEALAEYDNLRRLLAAELGLEPSPALQRLYQAVLSGDQSLNQPVTAPPVTVSAAPATPVTTVAVPASPPTSAVPTGVGTGAPAAARAGAVIAHAAGLPRVVEDFVGRRRVTAALTALLAPAGQEATGRLVTLSGPPGVGKTTVAVRLAHQLCERYPDGQLLVSLRDHTGAPQPAHAVLGEMLDHLGVEPEEQPASEPRRLALFRHLLADRKMLLVYDDPGGEDQVRRLLPGVGPTSVLVTSRRYLGGLSVGFHERLGPLSSGPANSLLRSAAQGRPDLDQTTAERIVECCGGLPMALRIAGIRLHALQHLSPARFAQRLEGDRLLDELVAGDLSVRTMLDRFWDDLDHGERAALEVASRLGPTEFELADFVAAARTDPQAAERALEALADCHAVQARSDPDGVGEVRFRIAEPMRVYAVARTQTVGAGR